MKIELPNYDGHWRTVVVEFKCRRCKKTAYRPLRDCMPSDYPVRFMSDLKAPPEWEDGGFYHPLFCPVCAAAHERFLNMEDA